MIGLKDLLAARAKVLEAEHRRERIFAFPRLIKAWRLE
jgi:hypothetical protein